MSGILKKMRLTAKVPVRLASTPERNEHPKQQTRWPMSKRPRSMTIPGAV